MTNNILQLPSVWHSSEQDRVRELSISSENSRQQQHKKARQKTEARKKLSENTYILQLCTHTAAAQSKNTRARRKFHESVFMNGRKHKKKLQCKHSYGEKLDEQFSLSRILSEFLSLTLASLTLLLVYTIFPRNAFSRRSFPPAWKKHTAATAARWDEIFLSFFLFFPNSRLARARSKGKFSRASYNNCVWNSNLHTEPQPLGKVSL